MALIICPNCKKEISDKAVECPACGYQIQTETVAELKCKECGNDLSVDDKSCPNCGCPTDNDMVQIQKVEVTDIKLKKMSKKKKASIIVAVVLIISIVAGGFGYSYYSKTKAADEYSANFSLAITSMFLGAVKAESAASLIHDVWYNTIYGKYDSKTDKYTRREGRYAINDDFNTSLKTLFSDQSFSSTIDSIEENQSLVNSLMKDLVNPPEEYIDAYSSLKELYDVYLDLTNCAINPTGSLQSFTTTYNDADSGFANKYEKMKMYTE